MTPHQVLSLLTQDQTQDLMVACCQYLSVEKVIAALAVGLEPDEMKQLVRILEHQYLVDDDD